ncbi:TylF/MycF/NovP-related O-methyltransferase [Helicobacter sp. 23-1044]
MSAPLTFQIHPSEVLQKLDFDSIVIGTFTGFYEIRAQLESLGIARDKIDVSHIELSVRAREIFLENFAKEIKAQNLAGNVAELGVYRGDFARRINECFKDKILYLFDTFEGFEDKDLAQSKDGAMGASLGKKHFSNTSVELVLGKMPYPKQCVVKKGWFPQSAENSLENEKFCFVNLDADLYEPILAGLRFFYPKMVRGGVILIHEYFSAGYVGVREAVSEFMSECGLSNAQKLPIGDNLSIAIIKN